MKHEEFEKLLSRYVDNELGTDERMAVDRHLETCEECRQLLADLEFAGPQITSLNQIAPVAMAVSDEVLQGVLAEMKRPSVSFPLHRASDYLGMGLAIALVGTFLLVFNLLLRASDGNLTGSEVTSSSAKPWPIELLQSSKLTPSSKEDGTSIAIRMSNGIGGRYEVNRRIERDDVQVTLDALEISDDKLTVNYHLNSLGTKMIGYLEGPRLRLSSGTVLGPIPDSIPVGFQGQNNAAVFAALPRNEARFSMEFGPFSTTTGRAQTFLFQLPVRIGEIRPDMPVVLHERVSVEAAEFRVLLTIGPAENLKPSEFKLRFEAINDAARQNYLVVGPAPMVVARDDRGNAYTLVSVGWAREPVSQTNELVKYQELRFRATPPKETIDPEARQLRLDVTGLGEVLRGPWVFNVEIQRE